MKKTPLLAFLAGLALTVGLVATQSLPARAAYFNAGNNNDAVLANKVDDDAFLAGTNVSVAGPVVGELFAAGSTVSVTKTPGRSLFAVGSTVTVDQGSGYNAFVAGQTVTLSGTYEHDVYVAASQLTIPEGTVIKGDLRVAGSQVTLAGTVNGSVYAAVAGLDSSAVIGGSLNGSIENLAFTGGTVGKNVSYTSANVATGLDKVKVSGEVRRTQPTTSTQRQSASLLGYLYALLSGLIVGAFLILALPGRTRKTVEMGWDQWGQRLFVGLGVLIGVPVVCVLLFVTLIGWKLAMVLLALYAVLLITSAVIASIKLGRLILDRMQQGREANLWLDLLLGAVVITVLTALPVVGVLFRLAFFLGLTLPVIGAQLRVWKE